MASSENLHSPLLTSLPSDILCSESPGEVSSPLSTIVLIPNSTTPPVSIVPSFTAVDTLTKNEAGPLLIEKRTPTKEISTADISYRLGRRKVLHHQLCVISDTMCVLGLIGVILMVVDNEMIILGFYDKDIILSWVIKLIITISTIILIGLIFYYHRVDLSLYAVNNSLVSWRIGITIEKILLILFEVFICAIHPIPRYIPFIWKFKRGNLSALDLISPSHRAIDVALSLPMFTRIYLICRFITFHSHLVRDASSQSLGFLNRVTIDFLFLIKTYLEQWPTRCLLIFCSLLFFIGSWSLRACNYNSTTGHIPMLDSMWLFIVTFTTVGYGDLTPSTYCGRTVAALTGLCGVLSTALLISVLAQKLQLTRSEKYVHNFVLNIELSKERKNQAANVIKFALKVWILKRKHRPTSNEYIKAQRQLFRSIHLNNELKNEQNKLIDNCIGLPELIKIQREANDKTQENLDHLKPMKLKVDEIDKKLVDMNETMISIQNTLQHLWNRMPQ